MCKCKCKCNSDVCYEVGGWHDNARRERMFILSNFVYRIIWKARISSSCGTMLFLLSATPLAFASKSLVRTIPYKLSVLSSISPPAISDDISSPVYSFSPGPFFAIYLQSRSVKTMREDWKIECLQTPILRKLTSSGNCWL